MNLLEMVREEMKYPEFIKMDPNTQEKIEGADTQSPHQATGQAAITAVLAGFYQLSKTEDGLRHLINKDKNVPWAVHLFGDDAMEIEEKIAKYGNDIKQDVNSIMDEAGNVTWQITTTELEGDLNHKTVEQFFKGTITTVLQYLPPALQIGKHLKDDSMDDRTHKMDGPVSGLMHKIEALF